MSLWHYSTGSSVHGPIQFDDLINIIRTCGTWEDVFVRGAGMPHWLPAREVPEVANAIKSGQAQKSEAVAENKAKMMKACEAHIIDPVRGHYSERLVIGEDISEEAYGKFKDEKGDVYLGVRYEAGNPKTFLLDNEKWHQVARAFGDIEQEADPLTNDMKKKLGPASFLTARSSTMSLWHYSIGEDIFGPVSLDDLRVILSAKGPSEEVFVWRDGMPDWLPASEVPEVADATIRPLPLSPPLPLKRRQPLTGTPPSEPAQAPAVPRVSPPVPDRSWWVIAVGIMAALVAIVLFLIARGMRINPNPLDQHIGIGVHFAAALVAFFLLHWRWLGLPEPGKKQTRNLAFSLIAIGAISTLAFFFLTSSAFWPWQVTPIVLLGFSICLIVVGAALLGRFNWARPAARIVAFPLSLGWPIGLIVALYAWWALSVPESSHG